MTERCRGVITPNPPFRESGTTVLRPFAVLVVVNIVSILATYAIAFMPAGGEPAPGLSLIHRYWDGPAYVAIARSLYDPHSEVFARLGDTYGISTVFAVYPLAVRLLSPLFGYLNAMLVATFLFSSLCFCVLYRFLREFRLVTEPLWCTVVFIFFPPRWVIYHSVAASEPPFLLFIVCALYCYRKRSLPLAGLFGGLAAVTRIYGVLLFPALLLAEIYRITRSSPSPPQSASSRGAVKEVLAAVVALLPIPALLGLHFLLFYVKLGNFWAYFSENAKTMSWVPFRGVYEAGLRHPTEAYGTVLLFLASAYGLAWLWRRREMDLFFVSALLLLPNVFTMLPDQARFMVPVYPFLLLIPFGELWSRWEAKWALVLCLPATYAYVWSSILVNLLPPELYERLRSFLEVGGG